MTAPFNLAAHVLAAAADRPDHPALERLGDPPVTLTYAELADRVLRTATLLSRHGLRSGDRLLLRLGNTPDFPIAYLAAIALDALPVPTSTQLTAPEVTAIAAETRPALVLQDAALPAPAGDWPSLAATALAHLPEDAEDIRHGDPGRPAYIIYTSGTSGQPRAVVHAHRAILARRAMWEGWYGLTPGDRLLHAGAFNWTYTLGTGLMDPWACGATALIPAPGTPPEELPALLAQHRATIFAAAPGVYRRLLRAPVPALPHLRHGLSAGEKLPDRIRADWEAATGTPIHEAYGMTECSTFLSGSPARPSPPGTLGYPQPGRRIALRDGVIAVHRSDPGLMLGYLDRPEETAARFDGDWFLTGDRGEATPDGAIRYLGRTDDMMNAGGIRVSPIEVETVLTDHPSVSEAACAEVRVSDTASVIAAFYVSPDVIDETSLDTHARARLAAYKVPRLWVRVDALPRGANNKLLRRRLRDDWEARHGQA